MDILRFLCIVSSIVMIGSSIPDIILMQSKKSNLGRTLWLPIAQLLDCLVGIGFSYLVIDTVGLRLRFVSLLVIIPYLYLMIKFDHESPRTFNYFISTILSVSLGYLILIYFIPSIHWSNVLGFLNTVTAILFTISPLVHIREVLHSKNASSIPFFMMIASTVASFCWFIYGLLFPSVWMWLPNLMNTILSIVQVWLCIIYPGSPAGASSDASASPKKESRKKR
jgi:uncharacterized protein with PQ loop repeat